MGEGEGEGVGMVRGEIGLKIGMVGIVRGEIGSKIGDGGNGKVTK